MYLVVRGERGYMRLRRITDPDEAQYAPGLCGLNLNPSVATGGYISIQNEGYGLNTSSSGVAGAEWRNDDCAHSPQSAYETTLAALDWARVHWGYCLLGMIALLISGRICLWAVRAMRVVCGPASVCGSTNSIDDGKRPVPDEESNTGITGINDDNLISYQHGENQSLIYNPSSVRNCLRV
jgi:hypothetical protein